MLSTPSNTGYLPPSDDILIDLGTSADVGALFSSPFDLDSPDQVSPDILLPVMDRSEYQDDMVVATVQDDGYPSSGTFVDRDLPAESADHLTALTLALPRSHPEHAPNINLALGMSTLTPANIRKFPRLYFHHWNRHSPVVHPGTFEVYKAPLPLLLVMTLTGACHGA